MIHDHVNRKEVLNTVRHLELCICFMANHTKLLWFEGLMSVCNTHVGEWSVSDALMHAHFLTCSEGCILVHLLSPERELGRSWKST